MDDSRSIAPLFLLALAGGYYFRCNFWVTKWAASRDQGQRLIFSSAVVGVWLTILAWGLINLLASFVQNNPGTLLAQVVQSIESALPNYQGLKLFSSAFFIGVASCHLGNFLMGQLKAAKYVIRTNGSDLDKRLERALDGDSLVSITLTSRKVYIGWPVTSIDPLNPREHLSLLPLFSGYREKDTLSVVFTTEYSKIYNTILNDHQTLKIEDFYVVVRQEEIISIYIYDKDLNANDFKYIDTSLIT